MKRNLALLAAGAVVLTACTDQPLPSEPTVSAPSSPEVTETAMTPERLTDNIAEVLEHPDPADISTGDAALEALTGILLQEQAEDVSDCSSVIEATPEIAGFGQLTTPNDDDDEDESQSLGAFEFSSLDEAEVFTTELQGVIDECSGLNAEVEPLNHHTDDAFEIQIERDEETGSSMVISRDTSTVLVASSTPPADVALSLTLTDQLQEMLR